jgi:hypothetical protein
MPSARFPGATTDSIPDTDSIASAIDPDGVGTMGFENGELRFKWYPNQKQLFEVVTLAEAQPSIKVDVERLTVEELIGHLNP